MGFELIEHTGDLAVRLRGSDLGALVRSGVEALRAILFEGTLDPSAAVLEGRARVRGVDREDLLVQALSEALHWMQTCDLFPESIEVRQPSELELEIDLSGVHCDGEQIRRIEEVKAVTYHAVEIQERSGELEASIVFDV